MEAVFLKLLNMSITASWLILGAILVRFLFKKAPKYLRFIAWALVGARLILPITPESVMSLIPSAEPIPQEILTTSTPQIHSGINAVNQFINPIISEALTPPSASSVPSVEAVAPTTPMQTLTHVASIVWICGMVLMLGYALISYVVLRRRVAASVYSENGAYICDDIDSPFVLGIIKPRIYMPSSLDEIQAEHVASHERAHIKRRDHWWKPLSFVLLSVYWFNPLIWVAYVLLCRDIELACDERVARTMSDEEKAAYSSSLLELSIPHKMITACPVAFGEVGVKDRIKSVLSYKKPTLWIIIAALVACAVLAVTLFTSPESKAEKDEPKQEEKDEPAKEEKDEPIKEEKQEEEDESPESFEIASEWDRYVCEDSKDAIKPFFELNETEKRYAFFYSGFSSHVSAGDYEMTDQALILREYLGHNKYSEYVFRPTENGYAFDAAASTPLPEYKYGENAQPEPCLADGAEFCLKPTDFDLIGDQPWMVNYNNADETYYFSVFTKDGRRIAYQDDLENPPEFSYIGDNLLKVSGWGTAYINLETGSTNGFNDVVCENEKAGRYAFIHGQMIETTSVVVCDMFDKSRYYLCVPLTDYNTSGQGKVSATMSDDGTVNLSYVINDGSTRDIVIDENTLNCMNSDSRSYLMHQMQLLTPERSLYGVYNKDSYEYVIRYKGREITFESPYGLEGRFHMIGEVLADLTNDGTADIIVGFPTENDKSETDEIRVFDGNTLDELKVDPIFDAITEQVKLSNDDERYYIEVAGEKYVFDRARLLTFGFEPTLKMTQDLSVYVLDNKIVGVIEYGIDGCSLVTIRPEYRFDGEKFVFGDMTVEAYEEFMIENENASAESTPDTAAPAAKPNRAPDTSHNTDTSVNIDANISTSTSTNTSTNTSTSTHMRIPTTPEMNVPDTYISESYTPSVSPSTPEKIRTEEEDDSHNDEFTMEGVLLVPVYRVIP